MAAMFATSVIEPKTIAVIECPVPGSPLICLTCRSPRTPKMMANGPSTRPAHGINEKTPT